MINGEYAIWISLGSLLVSVSTGIWSVVSWRRAGSHLRIHALLYRDVLLLWVFNAGRTADRVEELVIGGRRGGIGGWSLTDKVGGGFSLGPGESKRMELDWKSLFPQSRHATLEGGFASAWLLLGSMRQRRAEVLALPDRRPPVVGWRLAPRGANLVRYLPLALSGPLLAMAELSRTSPPAGALVGILLLLGLGGWVLVTTGFRSQRRKVERRYMAVGTLALTTLSLAKPLWMASGYPTAFYFLGALVIGLPGWLPVALEAIGRIVSTVWRRGGSNASESEDDAPAAPSD